jgi:hypothetical protein
MRQSIIILFYFVSVTINGQYPTCIPHCEIQCYNKSKQTSVKYTYKIIPSICSTWGYDIYKGEKKLIHQANIPGIPGNEGFKKKSDAEKVARLVIKKLEKGEMPPSVTIDEMKKLKVL